MANVTSTKRINILRNNTIQDSVDYFIGVGGIWKNPVFIKQLKDGEQVLGRYKKSDDSYDTLYGIAHIFYNTTTEGQEPTIDEVKSYIEVFKSGLDNKQYGDGLELTNNKIQARLANNGGLEFVGTENGKRSISVKSDESLNFDQNNDLSVNVDGKSIKQVNNKLEIGTIDCDAWDVTQTN